ncbi:ATP-binding protein [Candidatus Formimonas warabiya]|uniref:histidine kinase n=1 Tax=Formimonas warabiya TaxID=1761012 RepID=A0A3G1KWA1_FORW1|nr:ATP-binding protein [Candidatus Formimonas warabiya]ATW26700.1 hypothetical protein DCMF_19785 [Candidatus Formimonas warabiya]
MIDSLRLLLVEESEENSLVALKALHSNGYHQTYKRVHSTEDLVSALKDGPWDIVIVDISTGQFDELSFMKIIEESGLDFPCLILSEKIGQERHVKTVKHGIFKNIYSDNPNQFIPSVKSEITDAILNNMHIQADKDIMDQKEWLRVTLSSIGDAVITTDINGTVTFINPVAVQITGYSIEEATGKPINHIFRIFNEISLEPAEIPVDRVIKEGFIIGLANHTGLITKNGETLSIADSAAPIRSTNGEVIGVVMVFRDITESKRIEEQMARLDKLNLVGQMAAGIAHEIRNPMTTVWGFLQLLNSNNDFAQYQEYFELMLDELDRAGSIISGFLTLAKDKTSEAGEESLNRIIQSIAPLIQGEALMNNMFVEIDLGDIPNSVINGNDIRQLILNLVRNGLDASSEGDGLTIRTFKENGKVVLSVQDHGKGMDKKILQNLGTPFLTTKENGTGLGLFICYNIAEKNNASIEVVTGNNGTTISVLFKERIKQPDL